MKRAAAIAAALWIVGLLAWTGAEARPMAGVIGWLGATGPHALAALIAVFGAWGVGEWLRRWLLPEFSRQDAAGRAVVAIGLGLAALQTAAVLLGSVGLLGVGAGRGLCVLAALAGALALRGTQSVRGMPPAATLVFAIALIGPCLLLVGAPPTGPDEGQYHRRFLEHLLRAGRFPADPQDPLSGLAMGLHALLTLPASWTGVGAARPFCFLLGLVGLVGGHRVTRRLIPPTGLWLYAPVALGAATLLRTLPTINTDLTLAVFVTGGALLALDWRQAPSTPGGRPWALALLGGAALSIKYTAPLFLAPLYVAVGAALLAQPPGKERARAWLRLVAAALLPAAFALPWLIRNALAMPHALAPLAGFDPPPGLEEAFRFNFTENYGGGRGIGALLRSPVDLFVMGREFDRRHFLGRLNVWPLVALPGLLLACRKPGPARALVGSVALGYLAWASVLRRVVYLLPLWPLLASAAAVGLHELLGRVGRGKAVLAAAAAAVGLVAAVEAAPAWLAAVEAADVATGRETRQAYLERESPHTAPLDYVRRHAGEDDTVAMVWAWQAWDLPQRVIWIGAEEHTPFRQLVLESGDADGFADRMRQEGVRWIVFRRAVFPQAGYPSLSEEAWTQSFARPLAIVEEALTRHATERWIRGDHAVYELSPQP